MKTITLVLFGLLTLACACSADVLIYSQRITRTVTGNGQIVKTVLTGWMVVDATSNVWNQVAFINVDAKRGHFNVEYPSNWGVNSPSYGLNKFSTVISRPGQGVGGIIASGNDAWLDIGTAVNYLWLLPKTLKVSGSDSYTTTDDFLATHTGTMTYDKPDTFYANYPPALSFSDVITSAINYLVDKGYIQDP